MIRHIYYKKFGELTSVRKIKPDEYFVLVNLWNAEFSDDAPENHICHNRVYCMVNPKYTRSCVEEGTSYAWCGAIAKCATENTNNGWDDVAMPEGTLIQRIVAIIEDENLDDEGLHILYHHEGNTSKEVLDAKIGSAKVDEPHCEKDYVVRIAVTEYIEVPVRALNDDMAIALAELQVKNRDRSKFNVLHLLTKYKPHALKKGAEWIDIY